jgi:hypothetical protein
MGPNSVLVSRMALLIRFVAPAAVIFVFSQCNRVDLTCLSSRRAL